MLNTENTTTRTHAKRIRALRDKSSLLENLRIETVLAQQALAARDADKLAYHLPRIQTWARHLENV